MEKFITHKGLVVPLDIANVDTDQIIPKQFLQKTERIGFGQHLFNDWRYINGDGVTNNPDFVLNKSEYQGASILLARENFGCGSSREHAPWALQEFGFKVIIAPSFADIFFSNCFKNGILPVVLAPEQVDVLMKEAEKGANARITVDLEAQEITTSEGDVFAFEVDPFKKHCLLNGLDDISLTMEKSKSIDDFEARTKNERPWV